jgi:hypothetical protein
MAEVIEWEGSMTSTDIFNMFSVTKISNMNIPDQFSESLETVFWVKKYDTSIL